MPILKIPEPKPGEKKVYGILNIPKSIGGPVVINPVGGQPPLQGYYLKITEADPFGTERPLIREKFIEMMKSYLKSKRPTVFADLSAESFRVINFYRKSKDLLVLAAAPIFRPRKYCKNFDEVKKLSDQEKALWADCLSIEKKLTAIADRRGDGLKGADADAQARDLTDSLNAKFRKLNSIADFFEVELRNFYASLEVEETAEDLTDRLLDEFGGDYEKITKDYMEDQRTDPSRDSRMENLNLKKEKFLHEAAIHHGAGSPGKIEELAI